MRQLGLIGLLALGACAAQPQIEALWQKSDGQPVPPAEMRSAMLACGQNMANQVYYTQTPPPTGSVDNWIQQNWQLENSPSYGQMSNPEVGSCLQSLGYVRVVQSAAEIGSGSSVPPQGPAGTAVPPQYLYVSPIQATPCCRELIPR